MTHCHFKREHDTVMFHNQNGHLTSNKIGGGMDYNQQSQDRIGYVMTLHPTNNVPFGGSKVMGDPQVAMVVNTC
jgi:hypothetical protein